MQKIWHVLYLCLSKYYPPKLWVFYPLYKFFRRRLKFPMLLSNLFVYLVSAVLHGLVVGLTGNPVAVIAFSSIFIVLGVASSVAIYFGKRNCLKR